MVDASSFYYLSRCFVNVIRKISLHCAMPHVTSHQRWRQRGDQRGLAPTTKISCGQGFS